MASPLRILVVTFAIAKSEDVSNRRTLQKNDDGCGYL
jgi:hypothetical protein